MRIALINGSPKVNNSASSASSTLLEDIKGIAKYDKSRIFP